MTLRSMLTQTATVVHHPPAGTDSTSSPGRGTSAIIEAP